MKNTQKLLSDMKTEGLTEIAPRIIFEALIADLKEAYRNKCKDLGLNPLEWEYSETFTFEELNKELQKMQELLR